MSRTTIIKCNIELEKLGLIAKQRYIRREKDLGHNRVYLTHSLRRGHTSRIAETFRLLVNSFGTMCYESKCELENALCGILSERFRRAMRYVFRSTRVAGFMRRLFCRAKESALSLFTKKGGSNLITRYYILQP